MSWLFYVPPSTPTTPFNPAAITITGGTINGTTIGLTSPAAGAFTTLTSAGAATLASASLATPLPVPSGGTGAAALTGYVKGNGTGALTASATIPSTVITGLGTMAAQNAGGVAITGGAINGTPIGGDTAAFGQFTSVNTDDLTVINPVYGLILNGGSIDNTVIGGAEPLAGTFTNLTATLLTCGNVDITGGTLYLVDITGCTFGGNPLGSMAFQDYSSVSITGGQINANELRSYSFAEGSVIVHHTGSSSAITKHKLATSEGILTIQALNDAEETLVIPLTINEAGRATFSNGVTSYPVSATVIPLIVKGAASQSASLQEWQTSGGTAVAKVHGASTNAILQVIGSTSAALLLTDSSYSSTQKIFRIMVDDGTMKFQRMEDNGTTMSDEWIELNPSGVELLKNLNAIDINVTGTVGVGSSLDVYGYTRAQGGLMIGDQYDSTPISFSAHSSADASGTSCAANSTETFTVYLYGCQPGATIALSMATLSAYGLVLESIQADVDQVYIAWRNLTGSAITLPAQLFVRCFNN